MPEPVVEGTLGTLGEPLPAEVEPSPAVRRILGRAPRPFADWATRSAPAFRQGGVQDLYPIPSRPVSSP